MVFAQAADGVDPASVPFKTLSSGAKLPSIGLGTFGSDKYSAAEVASAVVGAAEVGYRHFDCASVYSNEREVGAALGSVIKGGVRREELWITSKLWNDRHAVNQVRPSFEQSLRDLGLDYLDLYLIHWPFPNFHPQGCDVSSRSPDAKPYIHEAYMATWRELEKLVNAGLVRHIGTSNMTIPKLELLLRDAVVKPVVNEMELHPHLQQPALLEFVLAKGIVPVGYSPLGSPSRPERDRTPGDTVDLSDPVVLQIAENRGLTAAAVCLKWGMQRGHVVIPFSVKRSQYLDALRASVAPPLSDAEMRAMAGIDRGCRLVKGQVFLWKENQSWEDLWDVDGVIVE